MLVIYKNIETHFDIVLREVVITVFQHFGLIHVPLIFTDTSTGQITKSLNQYL